jgi:glycosyltransferase involved in cell wall biosynthesis
LVERGVIASEFEKLGIKIYVLNASNKFELVSIHKNIYQILRLAFLFRSKNIQIIHAHDYFPAVIARLAAVLGRVKKKYITLHNCYKWLTPFHHSINRILAKTTTKIVAISKYTKMYSMEHDHISENKYDIIYNGIEHPGDINTTDLDNFRKLYQITNSDIVIGNVGTLSYRKGHEYLIKAFSVVRKTYPRAKLLIVGGSKSNEPQMRVQLEGLVSKLGLDNAVVFTGTINNAKKIMGIFDLFVMSSVVEGFGLALAEAMLMKRLCVASDLEVFKEIMTENIEGFYFKNKDENSLASVIIKVLALPIDTIKIITDAAYNRVNSQFRLESMVKKYEQLYLE